MNLDLFSNLLNGVKENTFVQNFMKELSNHLEKQSSLKQENCLYQVVEIDTDGAYLQEDTVLIYKNGNYNIEENLTEQFFNSLVDIKEYNEIKNNFIEQSGILKNNPDTEYMIQEKTNDYSILTYGNNQNSTIKVPNTLIPFWAKVGENLCYQNGKFERKITT